jgi:excisionase family DNA binding protein
MLELFHILEGEINQDEILTKAELANRLKVTVSAINKWMALRRIPYIRLGRRCIRFNWGEVLKAINTRTILARVPSMGSRPVNQR